MTDNNWIEWKWAPEKPYPETLEDKVIVKFIDDPEEYTGEGTLPIKVGTWLWNLDGRIIAYKVVK